MTASSILSDGSKPLLVFSYGEGRTTGKAGRRTLEIGNTRLAGKTVHPFCTYAMSPGPVFQDYESFCPDSAIHEGRTRRSMNPSRSRRPPATPSNAPRVSANFQALV
jgi:hypothetical protein